MSFATPAPPRASSLVALDAEQLQLVEALDTFGERMAAGGGRGLYVHGAVGRGKTWLCDEFFESLTGTAKRRTHFHSFFRGLHSAIWRNRSHGLSAPGLVVADAIAELLDGVDLLYFDEFHVHDSGDAALISRLLEEIFARGVSVLATSNYTPDDLMPEADFHDLFEPAIALIEHNMDVFALGGTLDYRRLPRSTTGTGFAAGGWLTPGTARQFADAGLVSPHPDEEATLSTDGHDFIARRASDGQVWFRFEELCEADSSVSDYLSWASVYPHWVVEGVPPLDTTTTHARQRFANLIDVLADKNVTLQIVSDHTADHVLQPSAATLDFARTTSRLALLRQVP